MPGLHSIMDWRTLLDREIGIARKVRHSWSKQLEHPRQPISISWVLFCALLHCRGAMAPCRKHLPGNWSSALCTLDTQAVSTGWHGTRTAACLPPPLTTVRFAPAATVVGAAAVSMAPGCHGVPLLCPPLIRSAVVCLCTEASAKITLLPDTRYCMCRMG